MMNKIRAYWLPKIAMAQVLLLLATLLFSWVGNLYGFPVQNLLAYEGIRWILRNALVNFSVMPVFSCMLLLMGWGLLKSSGWLSIWGVVVRGNARQVTPRKRWGFQVSIITLVGYLLLLSVGFIGSEPVLLSVTGDLAQSPIADGFILVLLLGILAVTGVYAWVSGLFRGWNDFIMAMIKGVADWSILFLNLFLLGQQIAFVQFMI